MTEYVRCWTCARLIPRDEIGDHGPWCGQWGMTSEAADRAVEANYEPRKPSERVLPLYVVDGPGGPYLRALCGAESAAVRPGVANSTMTGLRSSGQAMPHAAPDLTPAGVMRMVLHAKSCLRCHNEQLQRGMR